VKPTFPQVVWGGLACFRSVQLAIVLLSCMALGILAGVLLPQDGLVATLDIKRQYGDNYPVLKAMGLFNVYSCYWFIALQVLFFFNLLIGSFKWLRPAFLAATRQTYFNAKVIGAAPAHFTIAQQSLQQVSTVLKRFGYQVYTNPQQQVYATKGNLSRFGPALAHVGILLFLLASVYGTFTGFKAQKLAVPGDTFTLKRVDSFIPNFNGSLWQGSIPQWAVKINSFAIEVYPERPDTVKQYYCNLSILSPDQKTVLKRETISVNHPLSMGDVTIYQAAFNPTGKLFFKINGQAKTLTINTNFQTRAISVASVKALQDGQNAVAQQGNAMARTPLSDDTSLMVFPFFVQKDPGTAKNNVVLFMRNSKGFVGKKKGRMPPNLKLNEGETGTLNGMQVTFIKPEFATGLQIKNAPEVPWIYSAFLIIGVGAVMCVFSQRMLWLAPVSPSGQAPLGGEAPASGTSSNWVVLYKTNKGRLSFLTELEKLQLATQAIG
jgi:cytochrome c biogenesis protein